MWIYGWAWEGSDDDRGDLFIEVAGFDTVEEANEWRSLYATVSESLFLIKLLTNYGEWELDTIERVKDVS